jgi:hypothetical protein
MQERYASPITVQDFLFKLDNAEALSRTGTCPIRIVRRPDDSASGTRFTLAAIVAGFVWLKWGLPSPRRVVFGPAQVASPGRQRIIRSISLRARILLTIVFGNKVSFRDFRTGRVISPA